MHNRKGARETRAFIGVHEIIHQAIGGEERCLYLPDQLSRMRYRVIDDCTPETYTFLLERGWRRFGRVFFRPMCAACVECRSLRVDVERFRPNRSMRRTLKRNLDLRIGLRRAAVSDQHLELYDRYHLDMAERKGWSEKAISLLDYYRTFVEARQDFGHEMLYFDGDRPVAVALIDLLPAAISAVYCYYEPEQRSRALGVYSILRQIDLARAQGIPYVYLGYWIVGNPSMSYKANYRPHEILEGRPGLDEEAIWRPTSGATLGSS